MRKLQKEVMILDNDGNMILTEGLVLQDERMWFSEAAYPWTYRGTPAPAARLSGKNKPRRASQHLTPEKSNFSATALLHWFL